MIKLSIDAPSFDGILFWAKYSLAFAKYSFKLFSNKLIR